jgi:hypothetical protein
MTSLDAINCLLSHKCNDRAHCLAERLRVALETFGICLQIDPFHVGDDVDIRIQTFNIEAVVFLSEVASLASEYVQQELESASRQGLPVFTILLEGELPASWKKRSWWRMPPTDDPAFATQAGALAESIRRRVLFNRKIRELNSTNYFIAMSEVAKDIAANEERTILAEFAEELAKRYREVLDPTTRYWIAISLGRADTPEAVRLIEELPPANHPLEVEGIREAREMLSHDMSVQRTQG